MHAYPSSRLSNWWLKQASSIRQQKKKTSRSKIIGFEKNQLMQTHKSTMPRLTQGKKLISSRKAHKVTFWFLAQVEISRPSSDRDHGDSYPDSLDAIGFQDLHGFAERRRRRVASMALSPLLNPRLYISLGGLVRQRGKCSSVVGNRCLHSFASTSGFIIGSDSGRTNPIHKMHHIAFLWKRMGFCLGYLLRRVAWYKWTRSWLLAVFGMIHRSTFIVTSHVDQAHEFDSWIIRTLWLELLA